LQEHVVHLKLQPLLLLSIRLQQLLLVLRKPYVLTEQLPWPDHMAVVLQVLHGQPAEVVHLPLQRQAMLFIPLLPRIFQQVLSLLLILQTILQGLVRQ
jgi:hypothetical protein